MSYANKLPFAAEIGANPFAVQQNLDCNPVGSCAQKSTRRLIIRALGRQVLALSEIEN